MSTLLQFLRPGLLPRCRSPLFVTTSAHLRFYNVDQLPRTKQTPAVAPLGENVSQAPLNELGRLKKNDYPRIMSSEGVSCQEFVKRYKHLRQGETVDVEDLTTRGRIRSIRIAGSKLVFIDIIQNGHQIQALGELSKLSSSGVALQDFKDFYKSLNRGDIISLRGRPHRTTRGQLSILLSELPKLLSFCLHQLPTDLHDQETRIRNRHVDFLVTSQSADTIRLRSEVINYIRQFLIHDEHVEVQTPIIAEGAGGAIARPFRTTSSEFSDRLLTLRIAPELWLKRLVIGGFERVFEIGPCFRNEGLDLTHNPEYTTCEFYRAYADLEELIETTEKLIHGLSEHTATLIQNVFKSLTPQPLISRPSFQRLDFVTALESAINRSLPKLQSEDAVPELLQIFQDGNIAVPDSPTLPRLLDKLSGFYLEPQCLAPTFIINHPECISPLSKSFIHPTTQQRVAARAELFINGQEIVNTYEEENSPFEQRRKFVDQLRYRDEENTATTIDDNYLQALEWGLPPTGGWGCGIDRLCMLMSGAGRIGDVLSFGTLRNVVSVGRGSSKLGAVDCEPTES